MRNILTIISLMLLSAACVNLNESNPYKVTEIGIQLVFPSGYSGPSADGLQLTAIDKYSSVSYKTTFNSSNKAALKLPQGVYRFATGTLSDGESPYNASKGGVIVTDLPGSLSLDMKKGRIGDICIKEIYCGGCLKTPEEGTYNVDSYIILHNNSASTVYLDSLCFGTLDPYNSSGTIVWDETIEFVPVIQCVWQIGGSGKDHPLAPGQDAVISIYGAINHAKQYPLSVNLDKEDYFVCYNATYFPNVNYHPAPGGNIRKDHILDVVIKTGKANAYTFSNTSPAAVIFRARGMSIQEFVSKSENIVQKTGSDDRIVCIPEEWVEDGVEVFYGQSGNNNKRLHSIIDSDNALLSVNHAGKTVIRKKDETKSLAAGYEVLYDTNNSSSDFEERSTQLLHE